MKYRLLMVVWSIIRLLATVGLICLIFTAPDIRRTIACGFVLLWLTIDSIGESIIGGGDGE